MNRDEGQQQRLHDVQPTVHDILMGRGRRISQSPGNILFRSIILSFRKQYERTHVVDRPAVSCTVLKKIQKLKPPGRFLEKSSNGGWVEVSGRRAYEKVSQTLRERKISRRRQTACRTNDKPQDRSVPKQGTKAISRRAANTKEGKGKSFLEIAVKKANMSSKATCGASKSNLRIHSNNLSPVAVPIVYRRMDMILANDGLEDSSRDFTPNIRTSPSLGCDTTTADLPTKCLTTFDLSSSFLNNREANMKSSEDECVGKVRNGYEGLTAVDIDCIELPFAFEDLHVDGVIVCKQNDAVFSPLMLPTQENYSSLDDEGGSSEVKDLTSTENHNTTSVDSFSVCESAATPSNKEVSLWGQVGMDLLSMEE